MPMQQVEHHVLSRQYLGFLVSGREFYAPIYLIQAIVPVSKITVLPKAPPYVVGVMNFREQIIPVLDMQKRLHLATKELPERRILIIRASGRSVGLLVDAVKKILEFAHEHIEPVTELLANESLNRFTYGVCRLPDKMVTLLDIFKILEIGKEERRSPI